MLARYFVVSVQMHECKPSGKSGVGSLREADVLTCAYPNPGSRRTVNLQKRKKSRRASATRCDAKARITKLGVNPDDQALPVRLLGQQKVSIETAKYQGVEVCDWS
jgi:hypothetical protein